MKKQKLNLITKVQSLRIHNDNNNDNKYEYSSNPSVATLFHPIIPQIEDIIDDSIFWICKINIVDYSQIIQLYFDDRVIIKDALLLLYKTLYPLEKEYKDIFYLSLDSFSPPLLEYNQISYYLSKNKTTNLYLKFKDLSSDDSSICTDDENSNEDIIFHPLMNVDSTKITLRFSDSSKPLPNSPLITLESPRNTKPYNNNNEDDDIELEVENNVLEEQIEQQFLVIITTHLGKEIHFPICLNLSKYVSICIQDILLKIYKDSHINDPNYLYIEYGLFVPEFLKNKKDISHNTANCINTISDIKGFWIRNDILLKDALSLIGYDTPVLFIKPRLTLREILIHILPLNEQSTLPLYQTIEISTNIGVAMMIFSSKCTVREALKSIYLTTRTFLPLNKQNITIDSCFFTWKGDKNIFNKDKLLTDYFISESSDDKSNSELTSDIKLLQFYFSKEEMNTITNNKDSIISSPTSVNDELTEDQEKELAEALSRIASLTPKLISGEIILGRYYNVTYISPPYHKTKGSLFITNYQLIFLSTDRSTYFTKNTDCYIPLTTILRCIEFSRDTQFHIGYQIYCKDFQVITCTIENNQRNTSFLLDTINITHKNLDSLFCFHNKEDIDGLITNKQLSKRQLVNGWNIYDPLQEYERIGLIKDNGWRVSFINRNYNLCSTYPSCFVVPLDFSDDHLQYVAQFRSRERIPVTVWRHPLNNATITRCAQPRIGLKFLSKNSRSIHDEKLIETIRKLSKSRLCLVDCRPVANAKANHLRKGGYEDIANYNGCSLKFLDIGNIHVVREYYNSLNTLCQFENSHTTQWLSRLDHTHWLQMVSSVLRGSVHVVKYIDKLAKPIVVHCSDGWDRTSQICALAEFLLDPFYRTFIGFQILIEKEWISFGHKFATRIDHLKIKSDEYSPIFLVFIDCIYQILIQYPCSVEFNEDFLIYIMDHVYSCRFGTFICDCQSEHKKENISERTISIWTNAHINKSNYINYHYRENTHVLYPSYSIKSIQFWKKYYLRYSTHPIIKESQDRIVSHLLKENRELKKQLSKLSNSN